MTNKEILQANLLDIVFEHRNKNYGAYALRKNYPQRLQWSVLIALALASLLFLITILKKDDPISPASKGEIILRTYGDEKPPEQQKQTTKPQKQVSTVKATSQFQFTNEKPDVPDLDDFENSKPS